jgi:hypothetical protein
VLPLSWDCHRGIGGASRTSQSDFPAVEVESQSPIASVALLFVMVALQTVSAKPVRGSNIQLQALRPLSTLADEHSADQKLIGLSSRLPKATYLHSVGILPGSGQCPPKGRAEAREKTGSGSDRVGETRLGLPEDVLSG